MVVVVDDPGKRHVGVVEATFAEGLHRNIEVVLLWQAADADIVNKELNMLSILRKARLKDKEMRILMLWVRRHQLYH